MQTLHFPNNDFLNSHKINDNNASMAIRNRPLLTHEMSCWPLISLAIELRLLLLLKQFTLLNADELPETTTRQTHHRESSCI